MQPRLDLPVFQGHLRLGTVAALFWEPLCPLTPLLMLPQAAHFTRAFSEILGLMTPGASYVLVTNGDKSCPDSVPLSPEIRTRSSLCGSRRFQLGLFIYARLDLSVPR